MNFKGFDDWIEVFRTGTHTDSAGNTKEWEKDDLKKIADSYDPGESEAPIVIGHPTDSSPAYGWIEKVKAEGGILWAKCKDVIPEFSDMVKKGLFKKRSISLYPDLTLRHIGFLGATPPAVKGLADLKFSRNEEAISFEFGEISPWTWNTIAGVFRKMREWLIEKEGKETADSIIPDWDIEDIKDAEKKAASEADTQTVFGEHKSAKAKKEEETMTFKEFTEMFKFWKEAEGNPDIQLPGGNQKAAGGGDKNFSEADIETAREEAARAERKKVEAEFAEKDRTAKRAARTSEITAFCEGLVKEGKLTPALVKYGVPEILSFMADHDDVIEFGESKEKATMYDRFKGLLETELPKLINFGEIAKRDNTAAGGNAAEKLEGLIKKKREINKDLSYSAAFSEVQSENPDLVTEYQQEIAG